MRAGQTEIAMSKFLEAMHCVIASTTPEELGKVKLAKVLFFADLDTYRRTGKPMTDAVYQKRPRGPMPRDFYNAIDALARSGKIAQRAGDHFGYSQHQFWSLADPEYTGLTPRDVATLNAYTRVICENHTAASISEITHNQAWQLAGTGEEIPLSAFLIANRLSDVNVKELAAFEAQLGA
jgi:Protein of unknown function (DUF4065)